MTCNSKMVAVPGYPETLQNYAEALKLVGLTPVFTVHLEEAVSCDGLLLPGGGDIEPSRYGQENLSCSHMNPAMDEIRFTFFDRFFSSGRPVLGICQGAQLINIALGGDLIQDLPTSDHHTSCRGADRLHRIQNEKGSLLYQFWGQECIVNSSHHQGIKKLGKDLHPTAQADDGVIEAVEHETLPLLGVQFHPERMLIRKDCAAGQAVFQWLKNCLLPPSSV